MNEINIFKVREEPIKIAEMLINAGRECEANALQRVFGFPEIYMCKIYSKSDLREIAQHLLAYCEHYEENQEE